MSHFVLRYFSPNINCSERLGSKVDTKEAFPTYLRIFMAKENIFLEGEFYLPEPDIRLSQVFMRSNRSKSCYFLF